ncbi:hypothetical protein BDZ90DRAFT_231491 [Jaminaea rosea]|uniref:Uncharacterized protein n=1 Tax=Jaminaea rosea TaxID=1569628 RepID=A0A316UT91_9BASI|nr:hypothetical protein BDZ90DRAFT_231491 [Jaminaea rosea]PWN28500.1 hypothetical protein BDZ90DRAFT_231491 [Jaminaea rosea]
MTTSEDAALLAEIERLSGRIDQHRSASAAAPPPNRGRGGWRGRGWRGASAPTQVSRHRTLVINNDAQQQPGPSSSSPPPPSSSSWVRRKTTHNMSLVSSDSYQKTEPARVAALQAAQEAKTAAKATARAAAKSRAKAARDSAKVRRGDNMGEVIVDGVVFVFEETGTKLVKKGSEAAAASASSSPSSKAPLRTSVNGQSFIRTKRGNLISAELHQQRKAQKDSAAKMRRLAAMGDQIANNEKTRSANRKPTRSQANLPRTKGLCSFYNKTGLCSACAVRASPPPCSPASSSYPTRRPMQTRPLLPLRPRRCPSRHLSRRPPAHRLFLTLRPMSSVS